MQQETDSLIQRSIAFTQGIESSLRSGREVQQAEYWNAIGNFDPLPYWQQLQMPAQSLYGRDDTKVTSVAGAAVLQSLNMANVKVKVFEASGHKLEDPEGQGNHIIRQQALRDITNFIFEAATSVDT